jgi:hypothetical protein
MNSGAPRTTVSLGVAFLNRVGTAPTKLVARELLRIADAAMYEAKHAGGNAASIEALDFDIAGHAHETPIRVSDLAAFRETLPSAS